MKIISYKASVVVPFRAEFKIGFAEEFDTGSESWSDKTWKVFFSLSFATCFHRFESGSYFGLDDSNIKLELASIKMPTQRKVSKFINGLGEDM